MLVKRLFSRQKSIVAAKSLVLCFLAVFLLIVFLPYFASAQGTDRFGLQAASGSGLGTTNLIVIISNIIRIILSMLGILAVLIIMYAGFVWMTASGDTDKIVKAKKILINAIIGLVIIMSAFTIASFIIRALTGSFFPGGGGSNGTGGIGDTGRWGIGRGPIESVYPEPNASDVPINTRIIVTFKEQIKSDTICVVTGTNPCEGSAMRNVEICEVDADNNCVDASIFENSTVTETADKRTFVFVPQTYLGEKNQQKQFRVTLQSGISSVSNPNDSIFSMLSGDKYAWSFTTNGQLDLDPPEIMDLTGAYPNPDGTADAYDVGAATPTVYTVGEMIGGLNDGQGASYGSILKGGSTDGDISVTGTYAGTQSGILKIEILPRDNTENVAGPNKISFYMNEALKVTLNYSDASWTGNLPVVFYGLSFSIPFESRQYGWSWTMPVQAGGNADELEIKESGVVLGTGIYGDDINSDPNEDIVRKNIVDAVIENFGNKFEAVAGDPYSFKTKTTGVASNTFTFRWLRGGVTPSNDVLITPTTVGTDGEISQAVADRKDPFRNTIFQITFSEAIDPTVVDNLIVRKGATALASTDYQVEVSNQYRTVELRGNIECGTNSCGDKVYCWPVNNLVSAMPYSIEVKAAKLMEANDDRCAQWGGAASGGVTNRCQKTIGSETVFYPTASGADGYMDLSGNSFNGSFNSYEENNATIGLADGQSGTGAGTSGVDAYNINQGMTCVNKNNPDTSIVCSEALAKIISYGDSDDYGDNLKWAFYLSPEVDTQAPLVNAINPIGDDTITDARKQIEITFDRLMRSATLRPGYNYGSTVKSKSLYYLIMGTLTPNINPAGYWVSREDEDTNDDGWAERSVAKISHNILGANARYSSLVGSGLQSVTQNCFLPSGGPDDAGSASCQYTTGDNTQNCVRDSDEGTAQVKLPNPASYAKMNCNEIEGANVCSGTQICQVKYFNQDQIDSYLNGSWVITLDNPTAGTNGNTGCCYGSCKTKSTDLKTCAQLDGAEVCTDATMTCQADLEDDRPGRWIETSDKDFDGTGRSGCCYGKCVLP